MTQRDYIYFIMSADGRFYYESGGAVSIASDPKPLVNTPDGWLDIEIQRQRNAKYFALDRTFTVPLEFVRDGALILKHFYYTKGIEEKLYLAIADKRLYFDDTHYGFYYSLLYKGEIDLSQFEHEGPKVTLNIMEGGVTKLLKANENTKYEISLENGDGLIAVNVDGIYLHEKKNFLIAAGFTAGDHVLGIFNTTQEGKAPGLATFDIYQNNAAIDFATSLDYFLAATQVVQNVRLQGVLKFHYTSFTGGDSHAYLKTSDGDSTDLGVWSGSGDKEINIDVTFDAQPNIKYFLYVETPAANSFDYIETSASLTYKSRYASTYIRAIRPFQLFKKIAAKMGITSVESLTLQAYDYIVVTCGDAIRGFQDPIPVIKTSMNDFFQSFNTVLSLAMGVKGNTLVCESKASFVDYTAPIQLGECKNLKVTPAKEYLVNTIKIGYPEKSYEDVNGRYEFNTTHIYTTPITRIAKELSLVSVYRADSYGIEYTRINFEGKTTTDGSGDNDVFLIHIKKTAATGPFVVFEYFDLDRSLNPYSTGLLEPETMFNLWLSPKQCLLRNGAFIRSCFYKQDHLKITFQTTEKNANLVVSEPGKEVVSEKGDVEISDLADPLFFPHEMEFENKVPADILELLKVNPLRSYEFTNDGITYTGLPIKDSVEPANKQAQTFQLLSSPENSMEDLISYAG